MPKISIILQEDDFEALKYIAEQQLRDPRAQALLIIRNELISQNLIQKKPYKINESEHENE